MPFLVRSREGMRVLWFALVTLAACETMRVVTFRRDGDRWLLDEKSVAER
jgi:hypothetical protein